VTTIGWALAYIALLLVSVCSLLAVYHGLRMVLEVRSNREWLVNLFPFLLGAAPGLLTELGEWHRKMFNRSLLGVFAAVLMILTAAYLIDF
jgi:hypothetical protein